MHVSLPAFLIPLTKSISPSYLVGNHALTFRKDDFLGRNHVVAPAGSEGELEARPWRHQPVTWQ